MPSFLYRRTKIRRYGFPYPKFETKIKTATEYKATHIKKQEEKKKASEAPKSLREMLMALK